MESFEQKIKERNNLLKSQVDALTGRNEITEIVDTLLKAGVAEEDLVEKAKFIRKESDGKGGYKYIYEEPKENKMKTDKVDKKEDKLSDFKDGDKITYKKAGEGNESVIISNINLKNGTFDAKHKDGTIDKNVVFKYVTLVKSSESDIEKAETDKKKKKVAKVMKEFKAGTLKTSAGDPVKNRDQAIAIAMSEAGMSVKKSTLSTVLKQIDNDIEKSHLGEFSYSEKLGIKKTGKEIKEKFKTNLDKEKSELNELKSKLSILKTKISEEPTKKCDYWGLDAYEDKGIDIPLVYEYSYEKSSDMEMTQSLIGEATTPTVNVSVLKNQYNDTVRKYIDSQKEIMQINTILNNYKDTDIYQLTISQATVLGF